MTLLNPAPQWGPPLNQEMILWHGCTSLDEQNMRSGISVRLGRVNTDFGRGFYLSTSETQAQHWAWLRNFAAIRQGHHRAQPVLLRFALDRHQLSKLHWLAFVRGDYGFEDYWSFVQHCRQSKPRKARDHGGPVSEDGKWYDVVYGPVSAFWRQRVAMPDSDQLSFHTAKGGELLTQAGYTVKSVP